MSTRDIKLIPRNEDLWSLFSQYPTLSTIPFHHIHRQTLLLPQPPTTDPVSRPLSPLSNSGDERELRDTETVPQSSVVVETPPLLYHQLWF